MKRILITHLILLLSLALSSQNLGIGVSPTEKLDVNGNIRSSTLTGSSSHLACDNNGVLKKLAYAYVTGYNQADGRDVGNISLRTLTFTKKEASTKLRLSYTDNMRGYCNPPAKCCRWRFLINGADCPSGVLYYANYCNLSPDNEHVTRTMTGICGSVPAGSRTVTIYVDACPGYACDAYTGWNTTWLLEVEEIF